LCDHVQAQWNDIDVNKLIAAFNTKTAEIEKVVHYKLDISNFTLGYVINSTENSITLTLPEWGCSVDVALRTDAVVGQWYLIKKNNESYSWVSYADMQSEKEGLLKPFSVQESEVVSGAWRAAVETEDYIFEVDNKSITHRPDMWGHRGVAREVAALLNLTMTQENEFFTNNPVEYQDSKYVGSSSSMPVSLSITTDACTALSVVAINNLSNQPSALNMATRLMRVDSKFHDFIVDATNYVMFDIGHPMHAFDASVINSSLTVRYAHADEALTLLDDTQLQLTTADVVIADSTQALSLAGIKGGKNSGISATTTSVLLEAACFDAAIIRLSSMHHKIRTDASARFEKSLDPHNPTKALARYIHLLQEYGITHSGVSSTIAVGKQIEPVSLDVSQSYIEACLGVVLPQGFVTKTLETLEFKVAEKSEANDTVYTITPPTFRATKDIAMKEDIVEEVGRFYGYTALSMSVPYSGKQPSGSTWFDTITTLKAFLAQQAHMHETQNYALFDNTFVAKLQWKVADAIELKNPLSEQRTTMVTSLIPHLLQNIETNMPNNDTLAFFEWARVWHKKDKGVEEQQVLAGVWYERKKELDFYACKEHLISLFEVLECDVSWEKLSESTQWSSLHQVAELRHNGRVIGKAGKVSKALMHTLGGGDAFVFELDGDFIKQYVPEQTTFKPLAKFQATSLDITVMTPLDVTVATLTDVIVRADKRIFDVYLQDIFVKDEWKNTKSVTMRFFVRDDAKTMDKQEIETIYQAVATAVEQFSVQVPV
jgi:phenylalanyl-tRNA synthetase beta chain